MAKKEWELALGERSVDTGNPDELLRGKISERRRKELERAEEKDDAKHKADMAELKKKEETATKETEKIESKTTAPVEPPVKLTGEIALGKFDFQEQVKESKQEAKEAQQAMATEIDNTKKERDAYRDALHKEEKENLKTLLLTQLQEQNKRLDELTKANASKGSILQQLGEMKETGKQLGLIEPKATGDIMAQIELRKLDFELEDRKYQHDLDRIRLEDERADRKEERVDRKEAQRQQYEMEKSKRGEMADSIKSAAVALGKTIVASESGGKGISEAPPAPKGKTYPIELPEGQSGTLGCPACNEELGIGPTQRTAVCAGCGLRIKIKRVSGEPSEEAEEERRE